VIWDDEAVKAAPQVQWDGEQPKSGLQPGFHASNIPVNVSHAMAGLLNQVWEVSAPRIANEVYKRVTGQPNELANLPEKVVPAFAGLMVGMPETEGETAAATRLSAPKADTAVGEVLDHPAVRPWVEALKKEVHKIPGVDVGKTILDSLRGLGQAAEAPPTPSAPSVPPEWGKGVYGTPIDQWGQRVLPATPAPAPPAAMPITRTAIEQKLRDSLGGAEPLKPNVPLRQQLPATATKAIPQGMTPVESSSVLKAFKYNPDSREMEVVTNYGGHYVYGDVSPEQAQAFVNNDSAGQAWNQLRQSGSTLVAKVINGKRVFVKPSIRTATPNLADLLGAR
jgi:hypothetical protein